eukprot:TRINITY_DN159_c0_g1_i2.p1 TRINITY_DN159_c0_g1~~TRINITY_DN159_c0_g1_i2.p1  ORF type:complete len:123 (-),score=76.75 TRINITY_DN159_c0_g1_i2:144-512(-)
MPEGGIEELACTYAALILHDDNIPITSEKLLTVIKAAGVDVAPFWASLFARVLQGRNLDDLILNAGGSGGSAAPAPTSTASTTTSAAPLAAAETKREVVEEKQEEEKQEEEDMDMGFSLFGE